MSIADSLLPEFDHEAATTRVLLERVPEGKVEWRPHAKARSLGELAMHIASLPRWAPVALRQIEFDTNSPDAQVSRSPAFESRARMLSAYDEGVASARAMLAATTDGEFMVHWTLKSGGKTMFGMPRAGVFRSFILNHAIHHRGQLSVYLRLLDVPLPNIYGPTADTTPLEM